ncbi:MAG: nitroimidazol reductase NimA-like FMN-containing flavoprotein [Candidatus Azotimanducaceae bacterium]|jgi:nitroimidazol reductase NimA-like FMN-containing flavoprotein (pyridoxamine 5'-phosphate oxidase superfamily)
MSKATDHEVVSIYRHSDEQIDLLMTKAPECVLMWGTKDHWPVGVVHSFVWQDGHIWITFAAHRHRASAIKRDPRVSVTVSGRTSQDPECPMGAVTFKGRGVFVDDEDTKLKFYRALSKKVSPDDQGGEDDFYSLLDSPLRLVLDITPEKVISFDADKSHRHREGTLAEDEKSPLQSSDAQRLQQERARRGIDVEVQ